MHPARMVADQPRGILLRNQCSLHSHLMHPKGASCINRQIICPGFKQTEEEPDNLTMTKHSLEFSVPVPGRDY